MSLACFVLAVSSSSLVVAWGVSVYDVLNCSPQYVSTEPHDSGVLCPRTSFPSLARLLFATLDIKLFGFGHDCCVAYALFVFFPSAGGFWAPNSFCPDYSLPRDVSEVGPNLLVQLR